MKPKSDAVAPNSDEYNGIAFAAWSCGDYRTAALFWTLAISSNSPPLSPARYAYFLRCRGKAFVKLRWLLYALDDAKSALAVTGIIVSDAVRAPATLCEADARNAADDLQQLTAITRLCGMLAESESQTGVLLQLCAHQQKSGDGTYWLERVRRAQTQFRKGKAIMAREAKDRSLVPPPLFCSEGVGFTLRQMAECHLLLGSKCRQSRPGCASDPPVSQTAPPGIEIRSAPEHGRGLFATQTFAPGAVVFRGAPMVFATADPQLCAHCGVPVSADADAVAPLRVACALCEIEHYCSLECRAAAATVHAVVCGVEAYAKMRNECRKSDAVTSRLFLLFARFLALIVAQQPLQLPDAGDAGMHIARDETAHPTHTTRRNAFLHLNHKKPLHPASDKAKADTVYPRAGYSAHPEPAILETEKAEKGTEEKAEKADGREAVVKESEEKRPGATEPLTGTGVALLAALPDPWVQQWVEAIAADPAPVKCAFTQMHGNFSEWHAAFSSLPPPAADDKSARAEVQRRVRHPQVLNAANFLTTMRIVFRYASSSVGVHDRRGALPLGVAIYPWNSLVNHSCEPNIVCGFAVGGSNAIQWHAIRPIAAGEQLLLSYIDCDAPLEKRTQQLARYGFACKCPKCERRD